MSRAGFIAIVGAPNAGKSTFLNAVLGQKLVITSPKVQTTRFNVKGVLTQGETQFIFVDTPGIHKPKRKLDKSMVSAAHNAWEEADAVLLMVDATRGFSDETEMVIEALKTCKKPMFLAFNKVDNLKNKDALLPLMAHAAQLGMFKQIFTISALKHKYLNEVLEALSPHLPESPYLYDEETVTDISSRLLAAEITREALFMNLQQELPYSVTVETESYTQEENQITIRQNILVEREGQKKIVVGNGGAMIKRIGAQSRKQLESIFETKVNLFLKTKVRKDWTSNQYLLREIGLEPTS